MTNFNSDNIKVFPSSTRNDEKDRNSRLTSEQNLISIVNRLTGIDSFVIDGFKVDNTFLTPGSCNIHGYYFRTNTNYTLPQKDITNGDMLYFKIKTKLSNVSIKDTQAGIDFEELVGIDDIQTNNYSGLEIGVGKLELIAEDPAIQNRFKWNLKTPEAKVNSYNYYYLPILEYKSNKWEELKYRDININGNNIRFNLKKNTVLNWNDNKDISLQDFMNNSISNLIIDDGEI